MMVNNAAAAADVSAIVMVAVTAVTAAVNVAITAMDGTFQFKINLLASITTLIVLNPFYYIFVDVAWFPLKEVYCLLLKSVLLS